MINKIKMILGSLGAVILGVFYVIFKRTKRENENLKMENAKEKQEKENEQIKAKHTEELLKKKDELNNKTDKEIIEEWNSKK